MSKKKLPEIKSLIQNLKQTNIKDDTVIIIGEDAIKDLNLLKIDSLTEIIYSSKYMRKYPQEFWKFYYTKIYNNNLKINEIEKNIQSLIDLFNIKNIITLNPISFIPSAFYFRGNMNILKCVKCNKEYSAEEIYKKYNLKECFDSNSNVILNKPITCECNGKIKPTVLSYNENYSEESFNYVKNLLINDEDKLNLKLNCRNLIFIGVNFNEDVMDEFFRNYNIIKQKIKDENYYSVIITTEEHSTDIEIYEPDFATASSIKDSLDRLIKIAKE